MDGNGRGDAIMEDMGGSDHLVCWRRRSAAPSRVRKVSQNDSEALSYDVIAPRMEAFLHRPLVPSVLISPKQNSGNS